MDVKSGDYTDTTTNLGGPSGSQIRRHLGFPLIQKSLCYNNITTFVMDAE